MYSGSLSQSKASVVNGWAKCESTANAEVGGFGGDDGGGEGDRAVCGEFAVRGCHGLSWLRGW